MNIEERMRKEADRIGERDGQNLVSDLLDKLGLYGVMDTAENRPLFVAMDTIQAEYTKIRQAHHLRILQDGLFAAAVEMGRGIGELRSQAKEDEMAKAASACIGGYAADAPVDRPRTAIEVWSGEGRTEWGASPSTLDPRNDEMQGWVKPRPRTESVRVTAEVSRTDPDAYMRRG